MQTRKVTVRNPLGVHARFSARIVHRASSFRCAVSLALNGRTANARNIIAVMLLAASAGSTITIETVGSDEREAMEALIEMISNQDRYPTSPTFDRDMT